MDERARILSMLAAGKVSVNEAEELLDALRGRGAGGGDTPPPAPEAGPDKPRQKPKFLRVTVVSATNDNVNVRVPLNLVRAGIKLKALIPPQAMEQINRRMAEKGINFDLNTVKQEDIESLIDSLGDMEVNVDSRNGDKVKVFCE